MQGVAEVVGSLHPGQLPAAEHQGSRPGHAPGEGEGGVGCLYQRQQDIQDGAVSSLWLGSLQRGSLQCSMLCGQGTAWSRRCSWSL